MRDEDIKYIHELEERVHELEEENKRIRQIKYHEAYEQGKFDTNMKVWYEMPKLEQQNKELLEGLATIGNAIHEGEISGRGTDEDLILEIVDKHWRKRNE